MILQFNMAFNQRIDPHSSFAPIREAKMSLAIINQSKKPVVKKQQSLNTRKQKGNNVSGNHLSY